MRTLLLALAIFILPAAAFALPVHPSHAAAGTVVREAEVRHVIEDYIKQRTAALNAQVTVKKITYGGDLRLPAGVVSYDVVAPERWEGYGNVSLALMVRVNDEVKKNITVLAEVGALTEMVVATRPLERGEVLQASDLAVAQRDLTHVQGRFLKSVDEAVGLRVKSSIRANTAVRSDYLEKVPVVKSGQIVTLVAENEVVKITATGKAKNSGAIGEQILVTNTASNKDVAGRIVDANTVKVDF